MGEPVTPRRRSVMELPIPSITNFRANRFEGLCLGMWTITLSVCHFTGVLDTSIVSKPIGVLTPVWNTLYLVGGIFVIVGLIRDHRKCFVNLQGVTIEAMGLSLLIAALVINGIAVAKDNFVPGLITIFWLLLASVDRLASVLAPNQTMAPVPGSYSFRDRNHADHSLCD